MLVSLMVVDEAYARTDLKPLMSDLCEQMGPVVGVKCIELQRRLENENVQMDANGASACVRTWQLGAQSEDLKGIEKMVLSCFRQVSNMRVSDEVRQTCSVPIYTDFGRPPTTASVQIRVKRMMDCIRQVSVPLGKHP